MTVGEGGGGNEELLEVCEGDPKSREFCAELRTRVGGEKPEEICRQGGGVKAGTIQGQEGRVSVEEEGSLLSGTPTTAI